MPFVIVNVADGQLLEHYDPEYTLDPEDPRTGLAVWTDDPASAMTFEDFAAAWTTYTQQSVTKPLRPDGKPNRPLTTYTVEVRVAK